MAVPAEKQQHFNDWPNSQGFDVRYEELSPAELQVTGSIPAYAAGVLFRNGMGPRSLETRQGTTFKVNHWFDHLSQVHRFQIHPPTAEDPTVRVTHNSRLTCDGLVQKIMATGDRQGYTFAARYDPCMSFFQKVQSFFKSMPDEVINPSDVDVCVTLSTNFPGLSSVGERRKKPYNSSKINTLCNKTDNSLLQMLDPETLEPIGTARQSVLHKSLKGPISGAHAKTCPRTGDVFNYNCQSGRTGTYRVFTVSAAIGVTSVLATFQHSAAYLHSMFLTENFVVLCVWNSIFKAGGAAMLWTKNYLDALTFDSARPARWFVIDRRPVEHGGKGMVATYDSEPFFSFHTINAYEETSASGKTDIIADLCSYENLDVLQRFYIDNLMSDSSSAKRYSAHTTSRAAFRRFKLANLPDTPNVEPMKAVTLHQGERGLAPELPSLNNSRRGQKYRYVYGVTDTGKSTFFDGLIKHDIETGSNQIWSVFGQSAGEPIFVANPDSEAEDGGVLLSVVLDGVGGNSYLLVLDAQTMQEVGRAYVDGVVGFGFHGTHWPAKKDVRPTS